MRFLAGRITLAVAAAAAAVLVPTRAVHAAASTVDDRIAISANGESLTGTSGGGGGSLAWLHNFNADALAGVGVEHQALANAHWTFGSLNGSYTFGPGDQRYSVYGEAHEGGGNSGARSIHYHVETLGVVGTYFHRLSVLLEDREINIDTVSGNLPKLGVTFLWTPHFQTSLSYSYSAGGNLGTRLASGRFDIYQPAVNFLGGFSLGQATAAVLSYVPTSVCSNPSIPGCSTNVPGTRVKEGYVGATLPLPRARSELSLIVDYQDLSSRLVSSKRVQGTLNYIFHIGHHGT
jgi:hypothetical protein